MAFGFCCILQVWHVISLLLFTSRYILMPIVISSLACGLFISALLCLQIFGDILISVMSLIPSIAPLCNQKALCVSSLTFFSELLHGSTKGQFHVYWKGMFGVFVCFCFFTILFLSNLNTQYGASTHNSETKSHTLYQWSQPGAWKRMYILQLVRCTKQQLIVSLG